MFKRFFWVSLINLLPWFVLFILLFIWFQEAGAVLFAVLYFIGLYFNSIGKLEVYHHRKVWTVIKKQYSLGFRKISLLGLLFVVVFILYYAIFALLGKLFSVETLTSIILLIYGFLAIIVRKYFAGVYDAI